MSQIYKSLRNGFQYTLIKWGSAFLPLSLCLAGMTHPGVAFLPIWGSRMVYIRPFSAETNHRDRADACAFFAPTRRVVVST